MNSQGNTEGTRVERVRERPAKQSKEITDAIAFVSEQDRLLRQGASIRQESLKGPLLKLDMDVRSEAETDLASIDTEIADVINKAMTDAKELAGDSENPLVKRTPEPRIQPDLADPEKTIPLEIGEELRLTGVEGFQPYLEYSEQEKNELVKQMKAVSEQVTQTMETFLEKSILLLQESDDERDTEHIEGLQQEQMAEEQRRHIERELEKEIINTKLLSQEKGEAGLNQSAEVRFDGTERRGIYKPRQGDYVPEDPNHVVRLGIRPGEQFAREWLVGQIDRIIGTHVVPVSVVRDGSEGLGTIMEWKENVLESAEALNTAIVSDLQKIALLDAAVRNTDRHNGNVLADPKTGRANAIDNALSFSLDPYDRTISDPGMRFQGQDIPRQLVERIRLVTLSPELQQTIKACFEAAFDLPGRSDGIADADKLYGEFMKRLNFLSRPDSTFPYPEYIPKKTSGKTGPTKKLS